MKRRLTIWEIDRKIAELEALLVVDNTFSAITIYQLKAAREIKRQLQERSVRKK